MLQHLLDHYGQNKTVGGLWGHCGAALTFPSPPGHSKPSDEAGVVRAGWWVTMAGTAAPAPGSTGKTSAGPQEVKSCWVCGWSQQRVTFAGAV